MNKFELEVVNILKKEGIKIIDANPKYIDVLIEKDNKKISVEIKDEKNPTLFMPKAFGQLMASKYIYETNEEWLVISISKISDSDYLSVMRKNNIKIFTVVNDNLVEIKDSSPKKKDREVGKGIDYKKLSKIWVAMEQDGNWLHVAEISRRTGIDECTVRWYLDHYLKDAINEERIGPKIRLRLVRLKPNMDLNSYVKAINYISKIKGKPLKNKQADV